jgi:PAS domain S-box-containing protein
MMDSDTSDEPVDQEAARLRRRNEELESGLDALRLAVSTLKESERRFRYMVEHHAEGMAVVDLDERFIYSNESAERLFGVPPGGLLNNSLADFVSPGHLPFIREQTELRRLGRAGAYELEIESSDGARRNLSVIAMPWRDEGGRICGAFAAFRDTTELKRAEEQVRRERDRAQRYLDVAGVILLALDARQRVTLINRKGCELLGYGEEEIIGSNWFDGFLPDRIREQVKSVFDKLMSGELRLSEYHENPVVTSDGGERLIAWRNTLLTDDTGAIIGTLSSGEDITDRRRAETELVRLERLRAMGEMTAGISHNLNNILVGVLGHAQFLQKAAADGAVLRESEAIIRSARRAADLVQRLRWAVLGKEEEIEPVSVNDLVRAAICEARPHRDGPGWDGRRSIDVKTHLEEVPLIQGTRPGLQDILVNLMFNSIEAMPLGGTITIRTRSLKTSVELSVSDTGGGMDERTRKRVFEPFFTTKAEIGTGLGLSSVYGTVTRWGGSITVDSTPRKGTTFTIRLPLWSADRKRAAGDAGYPKKTEAIS